MIDACKMYFEHAGNGSQAICVDPAGPVAALAAAHVARPCISP